VGLVEDIARINECRAAARDVEKREFIEQKTWELLVSRYGGWGRDEVIAEADVRSACAAVLLFQDSFDDIYNELIKQD
jgi:hypothetical protein